jgi:hypothetical protein
MGVLLAIKQKKARKSSRALTSRLRSLLEKRVYSVLPVDVKPNYETHKIKYLVEHEYRPDWSIDDKRFIEVKGYFKANDRAKHLFIKKQHPEVTVYFIFGNSGNKLHKRSTTTYADWCTKYGFQYCDLKDGIPKEWFN